MQAAMSARAFLWEGIIRRPNRPMYSSLNRRTTSASSIALFFMAAPPSKEASKEVAERLTQVAAQGFAQVRVDLGGTETGMPQQELHDADVDALGQKLGREAVTKCVRGEVVVETALCPCQV